ncbi:hypothetical protein RHGRI_021760 [Rhododendron griersonianum]|uniref:Uncharacterized protein n=1 Tax=Rhododendron griersonianum TaxID=479676 RepID=A0AAV6JLE1_9ERIC|nr:hypothetical protein RHGRI_021760 [Rhododendron griersonianum]
MGLKPQRLRLVEGGFFRDEVVAQDGGSHAENLDRCRQGCGDSQNWTSEASARSEDLRVPGCPCAMGNAE